MPKPLTIKRRNAAVLYARWPDNFEASILLGDLRDACPCAYCTGEEIMGQKVFAGMKTFAPGMNDLVKLDPVGNYAVHATWRDGHSTGIYTWEQLRTLFEIKALSQQTLEEIDQQFG
jgi:ATP-binding protein involved in chromosome partitioning